MGSNDKLAGRRALVTGGAMGIGRGIAEALAAAGADVAVHHASTSPAETCRAVEASGRRSVALPGDLRAVADCARVVDAAIDGLGGLDLLVNNAGVTIEDEIVDTSVEALTSTIELNVRAAILCSQRFVERARGAGHVGAILNISSVYARGALAPAAVYSATKGATNAFTRALAHELAPEGFRVNAIGPGMVEVPRYYDKVGYTTAFGDSLIPLGRVGTPADIGHAAAFLLSDEAAWITGQVLYVDGGTSTRLGVTGG
jgi:glucose 1-dehydrogenase